VYRHVVAHHVVGPVSVAGKAAFDVGSEWNACLKLWQETHGSEVTERWNVTGDRQLRQKYLYSWQTESQSSAGRLVDTERRGTRADGPEPASYQSRTQVDV
jgi:hypothetical protein